MAGNTFTWLGSSDDNDAATLANWQIAQSGSLVAAGTLPGTLDTITLDNGGLINDSSGDLPLVEVSFNFAGSGGTLEIGNLNIANNAGGGGGQGSINVGAGATGTLLATGSVADQVGTTASGDAATLDVRVAGGTFDMQNAIFAESGGVVNVAVSAGATFLMDGGAVAYGGTLDVAAPVSGNGILVIGAGGVMTLQDVASRAESIAFIDGTGTLVLQQTGTVSGAILGFQAGDVIDLTALNDASLQPITFSSNAATLTDGTNTVVLPLLDEGFTAGSFQATNDGSGHVRLTTTLADADWLNGAGGDWGTGSDWSTGSPPGSGSNVVIGDLGDTFVVTATGELAHSLLLLAPSGTLSVAGSLSVATAIFDPVGTIAVQSGATVTSKAFNQLDSGGTLTVASGGQMTLTGGSAITGAGVLAANIAGDAAFDGATIDAAAGSVLIGLVDNAGTATASDGAVVTASFTGLGGDGAGTGTLTIDNAHWTDTGDDTTAPFAGDMVVGGAQEGLTGGTGTLVVQDHATLSDQNAIIAANGEAAGLATVDDAGVWSIAHNLTVGAGGGAVAFLQVSQGPSSLGGGSVSVGNAVSLDGTLSVSGGGVLTAAGLAVNDGTVQIDPTSTIAIGGAGGLSGLMIDAGATATVNNGDIQGTIHDGGAIAFSGASTLEGGTVLGGGTLQLQSGAVLSIRDAGSLPADVAFQGTGADLVMAGDSAATGIITGFVGPGGLPNTIDLPGVSYDAAMPVSFDTTNDVLTLGGGSFDVQATFTLAPGTTIAPQTARDALGGTEIFACYAEGTLLATPHGEVRIEALRPGDCVLALEGERWVARPVRWVGRSSVDLARHPHPERIAPVRIRAHAFAPDMPARDLKLSPEHAVFVDGVLMQAGTLRNGATVTQEFPARITYLHVELDRHAVLRAENLPAESYLDTGNRAAFAGEQGVRALHQDFGAAAWDTRACAELVLAGPRLAAAQSRLRARAAALGFALTAAAGLRVLADGVLLTPDAAGSVRLPAGTRAVRLVSRSFVPSWLGLGDDRRRLGVAVASLRVRGRALPASAFGAGWHAPEPGWRWTDGDAALALSPLPRPATLALALAPVGARYWAAGAAARAA